MVLYSLRELFSNIRDLAVWDIAINHDRLIRHQWPYSRIADHALYLYLFQQQRIRSNMQRDPRLPEVDLRDFRFDGVSRSATRWYHPEYGLVIVGERNSEGNITLHPIPPKTHLPHIRGILAG
ncbi:MAG: hypothetical protein AAFU78_19840 [Cyanobacteria bacterium J06633_2]